MASVSSLDKDLRRMRLDKYTPAAANEARNWVEGILGERLPSADLLEGLKDGVALCRLVNLAVPPPGIRFKKSPMPFVQMENISLFLRACQSPPLNLQQHDVFLTVDLYEQKDPAQVLQCLGAFSRAAHQLNPGAFPTPIGPKARGLMSPQSTGPPATPLRGRHESNASNTSSAYGPGGAQRPVLVPSGTGSDGRRSPTKSPSNGSTSPGVAVSSWSRREHEGSTAPAWNIAQYGYMGGASQGNLGIAFGMGRQITSASPYVPSLADKERKRKEQAEEAERKRQEAEEEERQRRAELEAEEERARIAEERRWEEETRKAREDERRKVEEEKRQWEEEERTWRLTEEKRRKEEEEAEARLDKERRRARSRSRGPLRGQFLSQYQAEQAPAAAGAGDDEGSGYTSRVKELEKELELARQREHEYERERRGDKPSRQEPDEAAQRRARSRSRGEPARQDSWVKGQREHLTVSPKLQHQPQPQFPPRSPQLQTQQKPQQPQLPPRSLQPQAQQQPQQPQLPQLQAQKQPQPQLPPKSPRLRSRSPQPQPPVRSPQPAASPRPLPNPMIATSPRP